VSGGGENVSLPPDAETSLGGAQIRRLGPVVKIKKKLIGRERRGQAQGTETCPGKKSRPAPEETVIFEDENTTAQ